MKHVGNRVFHSETMILPLMASVRAMKEVQMASL